MEKINVSAMVEMIEKTICADTIMYAVPNNEDNFIYVLETNEVIPKGLENIFKITTASSKHDSETDADIPYANNVLKFECRSNKNLIDFMSKNPYKLCTIEYFNSVAEKYGLKNNGEIFEAVMHELNGLTYKRSNLAMCLGGDIIINNKRIQLKFARGSFPSVATLTRFINQIDKFKM